MPDPGSGGGGQISHLILDDGKSPKGLVCHLRCADILQMFLCGCLWGALEIRLAPNEAFPLVTLLPPLPPIPPYFFLLSLLPMSGMQDHVRSFLVLSHTLPVSGCDPVRACFLVSQSEL